MNRYLSVKNSKETFIFLTIFSMAMGYLESAVVIYLREIYYPEGFSFPLKVIDKHIALVEVLREAATLIMLGGAGIIAGRTRTEKFGFFLYCFAIWDIFYYVFLKLLIGWPESLLTWDILFLIPVTWVGPVIAPVINSITMIVLSLVISYFMDNGKQVKIVKAEWLLLISGSLIIILTYTLNYLLFMLERFAFSDFFNPARQADILKAAGEYIPGTFPWWIYIAGQILLITAVYVFFLRIMKSKV